MTMLKIDIEKEEYLPGETVRGTLTVMLDKPVKARKIEITLEGKESSVIRRGSGKAKSTFQSESKIIDNASNSCAIPGTDILEECTASYPFEFTLPETTIPSFGPSLRYSIPDHLASKGISRTIPEELPGKISYEIKAKIDVPRAIDPKGQAEMNVLLVPRKDVVARTIGSRLTLSMGKLYTEAYVHSDVFKPGDVISGHILFSKDPTEKVRFVEVSLKLVITCSAQGQKETFEQTCDVVSFPVSANNNKFSSDFTLESLPDAPCSIFGNLIKIMWFLDVKIDIPRKVDKHLRIPLQAIPMDANMPTTGTQEFHDVEWLDATLAASADKDNADPEAIESMYKQLSI